MNSYVNKLEEKTINVNKQKASEQSIQFKNNRENSTQINNFKKNINTSSKTIAQRAKADTIDNSPIQRQENKTGLPDQLKAGIESLSGIDMSDTQVHYNSSKPAQLQAHAYAQGTNIHIASGQEKHLAHEAWHVVQQKQGRVKATTQLKGKTPINDDAGLEREADIMGAKALQMKVINPSTSLKQTAPFSSTIQRVEFEYDGKLLDSKKTSEFRKWVFQNKDKVGKIKAFVKAKDDIPSLEKIFLLDIIKEQSNNNLPLDQQKNLPMRSTVYGLDKAAGKSGIDNVRLAYEEGFRDFDAAVLYQKGNTYKLFKGLNINNGIVRITYKYKFKEYREALHDMGALRKTDNVYISNIILHDIPLGKADIKKSLVQLKKLGGMFNARIGLSNVRQIDDANLDDNLINLLKIAGKKGVNISSIQNRVSPSAPDKRVREIADEHDIDYMGFGLSASKGDNATCQMDETAKSEDYQILDDPFFNSEMDKLHLSPAEKKRALLEWGRQKGIKVISSSRDEKGMHQMREHYSSDFLAFLKLFGTNNDKYANSYAIPDNQATELFPPFIKYMESNNIYNFFKEIETMASNHIWRLYYKHCIVGKKDNAMMKALRLSKLSSKAKNISYFAKATGLNSFGSVTEFSEIFPLYNSSKGIIHEEAKEDSFPKTASSKDIVNLSFYNQEMKKGSTLYLEGLDDDMDAYLTDDKGAEYKLGIVKTQSLIQIRDGYDLKATYVKVGDSQWEKK